MAKPNNNYAAPHTPIASVKRPRSSLDRSMMLSSPGGAGAGGSKGNSNSNSTSLPSTPLVPPSTPCTIKEGINEDDRDKLPMSPMHPARPLVIREDEPAAAAAASASAAGAALSATGAEAAAEGDTSSGSWVGRQVDALFSPVLNFLNGEEHDEHLDEEEHGRGHYVVHQHKHHPHDVNGDVNGGVNGVNSHINSHINSNSNSDTDVPMDDTSTTGAVETPYVRKVTGSDTSHATETATSQETASHDDDDDDDDDEEAVQEQLQVQEQEQHQKEQEQEPVIEDDGSSQGSVDEDEFNPYVFIKSLPAYALVAPLRPPIALPPKRNDAPPISLVLDLDETLVHCTVEPVDDADLVFPVVFHGMTYQVHVRLRPHLFQFLEKIKGHYEVTVFTASQKVYANELLDLIDPGKYVTGVCYIHMVLQRIISSHTNLVLLDSLLFVTTTLLLLHY
jgi:hypothetical protein